MRFVSVHGEVARPQRSSPAGGAAALIVGAAVVVSGCGATVQSAARELPRIATPIVIDESIHSFEDPELRDRLARIVGSAEMQHAFRDAAAAAVAGGAGELAAADVDARAAKLTETVATAFVRSASVEIPRTLAPALRQSLVEGLRAPELREALRDTTEEIVRATLVGTRDVLTEMEEERDRAGPLQRLVVLIQWSWVIAALVGVAVALLAVWTIRLSGKAKALEAERARFTQSRRSRGLDGGLERTR
jgi:hypothetical protein